MGSFDPKDYWENRLRDDYSLAGVGYMGLGKNFNEWMYRLRREVFLKTVRKLKLDLKSANVLDIGSGTGFYVSCWAALGVRSISGTDITELAVSQLQSTFPTHRFWQQDIGEPMPAGGDIYDVIDSMDVLFHIVDDARFNQAIQNIAGLLKPGGFFIYSDNFLNSETVRGEHQVSRSLAEIKGSLQRAGLRIESRRPAFVLMNAPVDSNNEVWKSFWFRLMRQVKRNEVTSQIGGLILYQLDKILVSLLSESPTTEIMVCRKT